MKTKQFITNRFKEAGIEINGSRPSDIIVRDERFYTRVLAHGSLGLGEAYMDGWWDSRELEESFNHGLSARLDERIFTWRTLFSVLPSILMTLLKDFGSKAQSYNIDAHHYGIGNDLYKAMLDPYMAYTCGYWKNVRNLNDAQKEKFDLICRKIGLARGMSVLDLGCGWGGFLKYAAEQYGINGVGVTITKNQVTLGNEMCKGFPVEIKHMDYRDVEGSFDRVISIGLLEHVGPKYHRTFFEQARKRVKNNGLVLVHTIGGHKSRRYVEPWMNKYIFPGGVVPSLEQISHALQDLFIMEDWHNFGYDYYKTLMAWFENFDRAWPELKKSGKYDDRFYRMWKYYLLSTAGAFKARRLQLWQIVLSPKGVSGGYKSVR
ncbi:MAG: cyclopropane fatty acyl phospholipid synthase [Patescibacteria group bacterium]